MFLFTTVGFIFALIPFILSAISDFKIVLFYGEVIGITDDSGLLYQGTWDECMAFCYGREECVLMQKISKTQCKLFNMGEVKSIKKMDNSSDQVLGLKTKRDTCPTSKDAPLFGSSQVLEAYSSYSSSYRYTITQTSIDGSTHFSFSYLNYFICQPDSFVSGRTQDTVCISTRAFKGNYCQDKEEARSLCLEDGGMGMSGPFTQGEGQVIVRDMNSLLQSNPAPYSSFGFWLDGDRTSASTFQMTDSTLTGTSAWFIDQSSYSNPDYWCCYIVPSDTITLHATLCNTTIVSTDFCMRGAVCRTKPLLRS